MTFYVGQRVVCVGLRSRRRVETLPEKGAIYTIRQVLDEDGEAWVRLVEIVNPPLHYAGGVRECVFLATAFRPVKTTDISVFQAMLAPSPKQPARVD